jgi:hypothetical protein
MTYKILPNLILGFHGCDQSIKDEVLQSKTTLNFSTNDFDWLGNGIYFWENDPDRAYEFAVFKQNNPHIGKEKIKTPAVIGAVISLGYCLNLVESDSLLLLEESYKILKKRMKEIEAPMPQNSKIGNKGDKVIRRLDCAVIQNLHSVMREKEQKPFDSVRGVFWEGRDLYPNAGFKQKNHIQICILNPDCIKGYFNPLHEIED